MNTFYRHIERDGAWYTDRQDGDEWTQVAGPYASFADAWLDLERIAA